MSQCSISHCIHHLLTYISIRDEINIHVAANRLFEITPPIPGDPIERTMLVSAGIYSLLQGPWENRSIGRRAGRLRADLEVFVKGQVITVSLTPYQHKTAFMGLLDRPEDEVWDIRSRDPNPGLRLFGRFAEIEVFIALNWRPRSVKWLNQKPLGNSRSIDWHLEILECQQAWSKLFPNHTPISGVQIDDYISERAISI